MKIATSFSSNSNLNQALEECCSTLQRTLEAQPDLTLFFYTENFTGDTLAQELAQEMSAAKQGHQVHGCSTCLGVMDNHGFHGDEASALGLWGIHDPQGAYGSAVSAMEGNPRLAAANATSDALNNAQRAGEMPDLIWLNSTPGSEEAVILGIQDVVGVDVPIIGGSAADNQVAGKWSLFANGKSTTNGVAISVMFPSVELSYVFQSGYSPTSHTGTVTQAEGRIVQEIDNRPAAEVYNEWTGGIIDDAIGGGNVLAQTTLNPLGRKVGGIGRIDDYKLSHPDAITANNAIALFSEIATGDQLTLMSGSKNSLISRAERVVKSALDVEDFSSDNISGALMVFCAGCMLTIKDDMGDVSSSLNQVLNNKPFISVFTFGEQGCFVEGGNIHGNLMISAILFNGD